VLKQRLEEVLQLLLSPIRDRRREFGGDLEAVRAILRAGTARMRETAAGVLRDVRAVFRLDPP
jgi:tryptophanyl-tRNA synthetase